MPPTPNFQRPERKSGHRPRFKFKLSLAILALVALVVPTASSLVIDAVGGPLKPVNFKVASMASKLEHWFTCHRFALSAASSVNQQQEQASQQQSATSTSASQQPNVIPSINSSARQSEDSSSSSNNNNNSNDFANQIKSNKSAPLASCAAHFDGHLCWPPAFAGQTIELPCPRLNWLPKLMATTTSGRLIDGQLMAQTTTTTTTTTTSNSSSVIDSISPTLTGASTSATANNQSPRSPEVGESRSITSSSPAVANGGSGVAGFTESPDKFAYRRCEPQSPEAAAAAWQAEAYYSNCKVQGEDSASAASMDPTDKWIKLNADETDRRLFQILVDELERIEATIDPYSDPDLLEQWTMCIGEIMQSYELADGPKSNSDSDEAANLNSGNANSLSSANVTSASQLTCPIIFDGWRCWPATKAGDTAYVSCPSNQLGFSAERKAHKICTQDGTWYRHPMTNRYWSNYTTCVDTDDLGFRRRIINLYVIGNLISLVALTASLIIFVSFKSLNCTRVTIHKNLFLSFITNNLMWVIWYTYVVNNPDLLNSNPIECRLWHILLHYFLVSNYFWMFCEGLYLHTLLVVAFVSEDKILKWFYLLGWLTPIPVTIAYAYRRSSDQYYTNYCWMEESPHNLILMAPIGISLLLNLIFLINIVRVLVTKLRANNSPDTHQTRKAVRATLFLVPLLGLHYMLTPFRPEAKSEWETIYEIIAAVCTSFQGLCVAMLFCFCNGEVIAVIKKKLKDTCGLNQQPPMQKLNRNGTNYSANQQNNAISHHNNNNNNNNNHCHYDDFQNDRRLSLATQMRNRSNTLTSNVAGSELLQGQSIACNDFGKSHCFSPAAAPPSVDAKTMVLANSSHNSPIAKSTMIPLANEYFPARHRTSIPQTAPLSTGAAAATIQFNGTAHSSNSNCSSLMTTITASPVLVASSTASGNGGIFPPELPNTSLVTSTKPNGVNVTNIVKPLDSCRPFELDETVNLLADHQQQQQATMIATTNADGKTTTTATATTSISIA